MSELLGVDGLTIQYRTSQARLQAVTDASFSIEENEFFGMVGESGSGKSTLSKALIGLLDPNGDIVEGVIRFKGKEIQDYTERDFNREIRWKEIAIIPQSSMNSLDPIERLDKQAIELAQTHTDWSKQETLAELSDLFEIVGLPADRIYDYPFQFSGGMQQRAVIALALLLNPSLIIADEPTTALDVIMQDQIFKYINRIKEEKGVGMLLITHDISVVFENCDSLVVLHGGHIAERGDVGDIFLDPSHPYTRLLQQSYPDIRYPDRDLAVIEGKPPQLRGEVNSCTFADRCPWEIPECTEALPDIRPLDDKPDHYTSCIRSNESGLWDETESAPGDSTAEVSDD